jgi:hypothetical protein
MANARIVLAQGLIDGVNRVFSAGEPYVAGSVAFILNGRIHNQASIDSDYGFIELSPDAGTIQVTNAPLVGDVVQIFYWSRRILPPPEVTRLTGNVDQSTRVAGVVRPVAPERLSGVVRAEAAKGVVRTPSKDRLAGVVRVARVTGVIREKC